MSVEANKAVVLGYMEQIWNKRRLDLFDRYIAEDVALHSQYGDLNRDAMKNAAAMSQSSMPDITVSIEDVIAAGDRVVLREMISGTPQGEFLGMPATGAQITFASIYIFRVADGKIAEIWGLNDTSAVMQQMGAAPMSAQAG